MSKYFVTFNIPRTVIQEWVANADEATRKEQTEKMMHEWQEWMVTHKDSVADQGLPLGKTKRITAEGVSDSVNDLNYYIVVEAESHEAAAEMLKGHPHLQIPGSYVEVIDASRPGM
jgi:hypothetical protein